MRMSHLLVSAVEYTSSLAVVACLPGRGRSSLVFLASGHDSEPYLRPTQLTGLMLRGIFQHKGPNRGGTYDVQYIAENIY